MLDHKNNIGHQLGHIYGVVAVSITYRHFVGRLRIYLLMCSNVM